MLAKSQQGCDMALQLDEDKQQVRGWTRCAYGLCCAVLLAGMYVLALCHH